MSTANVVNPEVVARSLRALNHSLTTPSVCAVEESGSRSVLGLYSTSPASMRSYGLVIVHEEIASGALPAEPECGWMIERLGGVSWQAGAVVFGGGKALVERPPTIDTASDIAWMRHDLEIGMNEIASLFGVTRKAVYDWTNGAKATNASYIKAVRSLIERELPADLRPYLRQFWDFDAAGGEPLVSILKSGDVNRLGDAQHALRALAGRIADYVEKIKASSNEATVPHVYNHDEY